MSALRRLADVRSWRSPDLAANVVRVEGRLQTLKAGVLPGEAKMAGATDMSALLRRRESQSRNVGEKSVRSVRPKGL